MSPGVDASWRCVADRLCARQQAGGVGQRPLLACLCAAWCYVCRDFAPVFEQVAAQHPEVVFAWVDVEEDEALGDDLDIENFPTLLLVRDGAVVHLGPVLARAATVEAVLARGGC